MYRIERLGMVGIIPCPRCRGEGWLYDDHECGRCSGTGELVFDVLWLATLAHNLAVGSALCCAYERGLATATVMLFPFESETHDSIVWVPGCGRSCLP